MKHCAIFLVAIVGALALLLGAEVPPPVKAQETQTLQGQVVNGTGGASVEPGLTVMLHVFQGGTNEVSSRETTTNESGGFQFNDVAFSNLGYAVTMDYAGMRYSTLIGPEDLAGTVELQVYENTQDVSVIRVEHQALIITNVDEKQQQIEAAEFVTLSNSSDRTLIPDLSNVGPGQFSFLRFSVPPAISDFDIQSDLVGGEVIPVGTGFALTSPVTPGEHNLNFTFKFRYEGSAFSYRQNLPQGAGLYQVLIPQHFGELQVSNLETMSPLDVEGSAYRVWEGRDYAPGQGLMVEITNLPQPGLLARAGSWVSRRELWHVAIPTAVGLTLAVVLVYALVWSPRTTTVVVPAGGAAISNGDSARREALIRAIAALDEKFEQGEVPELEYQAQRARLKERITEGSGAGG